MSRPRKPSREEDSNEVAPVKFEDAIEQIESVIERIESGEAGLEQSLTEYARATKLIGQCRAILDQAEKRVAQLTVDAQGRLQVSEDESSS